MLKRRNCAGLIAALAAGVCILGSSSSQSMAAVMLLPVTGNGYTGFNTAALLDAQPKGTVSSSSPIGETTAQSGWGGNVDAYNDNKWNWIDFGTNYSQITITAAYCHFNQYANGTGKGFASYLWTNDTTMPPVTSTAAPDFGLGAVATLAEAPWFQTWTGSVTPTGRYLMINDGSEPSRVSDRLSEVAFYGSVPEPTSLALLGVGGLMALRRRR